MLRLLLAAAAVLLIAAAPAAAAPRASTAAAKRAESALDQAEKLRAGHGVRTGRELTGALRELALGLRHLRGEERAQAAALLARPTDSLQEDPDAFDSSLPAQKLCSVNFCVHFVLSGADAPGVTSAAGILAEAERVHSFENGTLGWREPPGDGALGGDARVDIYLKELSAQRLFGYAATDANQDTQQQHSYLVIDNDFDPAQYNGVAANTSLSLTLAHEYSHVLQYGYDVTADDWHYEASAVWMEHRFDPALDDWLRFIYDGASGPGWRSLTELSLTAFDDSRDQPRNAKPYGSAVWDHFLSGRYGAKGDDLQRRVWEVSDGLTAPSTHAYDTALKEAGARGLAPAFAAFSAATAEWGVPELGFALPSRLPDVERRGSLAADGAGATPRMDHLTFALYDVPDTSAARIRLVAHFPTGVQGALALVARPAPDASGPVTIRLTQLPSGGNGFVTLDQPHSFIESGGRITAVLVNADASERGYGANGWMWSRDNQQVSASVTSDLRSPEITGRSPAPATRGVATGARVRVTFSKPVSGVSAQSFSLRAPDGRAVPAAVSYAADSRTATLVPAAGLSDTTRYTARLTSAIVDTSGNPLAPSDWQFTTARQRPHARVAGTSLRGGAARFLLRSNDRDRLRWSARLVAGGRTVAHRAGTLRPGSARAVHLAAGSHRRARLVVELRDPQSNRTRIVRTLRIRP